MTKAVHPDIALFGSGKVLPALFVCEHYAGKEKYIEKAFQIQDELNGGFDITCDLEDGAPCGKESDHLQMILDLLVSNKNRDREIGLRVHEPTNSVWEKELDAALKTLGDRLLYVTIPKCTGFDEAAKTVKVIKTLAANSKRTKPLPIHFLIETPRALREVWDIAALPEVQVLDFGIMDFISEHSGAIPETAMRSPEQFTHPLIMRAKTEIASAALANNIVPSHNVSIDFKNLQQVESDSLRARVDFGFLRMWSIHPNQIWPIIKGMEADFSRLEQSQEIILAAAKANWAPLVLEGVLFDRASYRFHWHLLKQARLKGLQLKEQIIKSFWQE